MTARAAQAHRRMSGPPSARHRQGRRGDDATGCRRARLRAIGHGVAANVPVERLSPCETCAATGGRAGAIPTACQHCGGTGSVWRDTGAIKAEPLSRLQGGRSTGERALS